MTTPLQGFRYTTLEGSILQEASSSFRADFDAALCEVALANLNLSVEAKVF
jgi:hypothetical protein